MMQSPKAMMTEETMATWNDQRLSSRFEAIFIPKRKSDENEQGKREDRLEITHQRYLG